ncbi:unnamed protein product [Danaus chrysippus]|uniref:(African queen) hypothetical protein n=1 Tax=Danaus chrysippus TaxID=151541 RepID=A0A8J2RGF7_9NEOP|nr:unnamed protein product [Danaus chrysippus]
MWVMNKSFELVFQFDKNNSNYHPLSANKGIFYFLKWINGEVEFYSASLECHEEQQEEETIGNKSKISNDLLKLQLTNFVDEIITNTPKPADVLPQLQQMFHNIDENRFLWTTDRIFLLEQSSYWPKIGLKFLASIIEVLETSIRTVYIRSISIDDLDKLQDHIIYISELKEKYKINMLLSEFSSQSPSEIALIMLRRCYTEDLEAFVSESLPKYVSRHLLDMDETLRSFIESEAASSGGSIDGPRLKILLSAFRAPCNKLNCLLNVLKILDVPWDTTVLTIATEAASLVNKDFTITESDRVIAQEIYKELNYAKIKVILKKYNFPLTCTDYRLVLHKVISAQTVDLEDLEIFTNILTNYTGYACILYIDRCLQDCDTKKALIYFKNINNRNKRMIVKAILTKFEQIIANGKVNQLLERNYIDFLKGTQLLNIIQINSIENLYHLKNSYNIKLNLNEINSSSFKESTLQSLKDNEEILSSSLGRGRCVSQLLGKDLSRKSQLIRLLQGISSSRTIRMHVESLMLCDENETSVLLKYKDGQNSNILLESHNILSEVSINCNEENIHEVLKSLSKLNALINASTILKNLSVAWKFQYIFLPMSTIHALNDLINIYTISSQMISVEDFLHIASKGEFIIFRIIANMIQKSLGTNATLCDKIVKARDKVTKRMLAKIVSLQDLDQVLITSFLLTLRNTAFEDKMWILELLKGQSDSLSPSAMHYLSSPSIRRIFAIDDILPGNSMSYPPQYILKSKFNINLSEVALPENEETWDVQILLFYILRRYPNINFTRLIELCQTLNINPNEGLSLLLICVLSTWDLKYKIYENELGYRQILTEHDQTQLMSQCFVIWHSIKDKDLIRKIFNDLWKTGEALVHGCHVSINPYFYEIYICIYHLVFSSPTDTKYLKKYYLLNFLKGYQRRSVPKQYEFELFSIKGIFPEIGYYRLPFHLFMRDDMWSNLKSEITLETYESWLPIVSLLSLDGDSQTARDMICSNAVKQTMTNRKRADNNEADLKDEPWRLTSQEEPLLRTAHRCVRHIANMEWAGACLFYALQGCARGADQVAAAQLCYQFSQRWATLQPGNRAVRQMEKLHSSLSTRHVLHKIEWACEELIRLSTEPVQLINALYLHPKFVEKITRHDINRAANEIADKNNINISSIRIQLLESILDKTYKENNVSPGLDPKDLITAKYILKATCPKMGAFYLSRIAFDDESDYNKRKKLRALQCLMSAVEPETAVKVARRERNVLWKSLIELFYIVHLERIDVPWIIATFLQDKTLALNQLLQVSGNNIESLKIAAELANKFGDSQIIRELIPVLMRASLFEEMIPLLLKVQNPPDNMIYSAWRAIMLSPFQRADYPITDRQKAKCLNALNLLPVCPVIKDKDLIEIWKNCIRCKCLGLGCLLLPYMTAQARQSLTELKTIDKRTLVINLKNLHNETYLVSGAMFVLENLTPKLSR